MKFKIFILLFTLTVAPSFGQEMTSKGDQYFYGYAYEDAILEYNKQMQSGKFITNHQLLNLADSYFKTGEYNKASKLYLDINKNDTIMSAHRFNKMLQSLAKISEQERVKAFLKSKSNSLESELVENAEFNYLLQDKKETESVGFFIFTLNGNSEFSDFSPAFHEDKLLFSSGRKNKSKRIYGPSGESYLDIYEADIEKGGNISNVNVYKGVPDSPFHKSTPYYSSTTGGTYYVLSNANGKHLSFDEKGKNALAIGMAYEGGLFRFLLKDLSTSFYYPFYDEASERLYFAANFDDSYGGTDLYYVVTNNGQVMSEPINMGPRINTPGNEIAPFVYDNSLFFSSDVFYGMGGMDVYRSNIQPDNTFSIPVNLGEGINTKYDEFGFIIRPGEGHELMGYFSSNRPGGKGNDDVYGFKVSGKPGPRTLIFKGTVVKPPYDTPISDVEVKVFDNDGNILSQMMTDNNGAYQVEIPYTDVVSMKISKDGYSTFTEKYNPKELEELQKAPSQVQLVSLEDIVREKEDKNVLSLNNFYFETGKSNVTIAMTPELDKVVDAIKKFPKLKISIETHTDSRGGSSSNKRISEKRSAAIKAYLLANGVPKENITKAVGYGEEKITNNCTNGVYCLDFLHKQNLRTLFVIDNYDELSN
ncbi:OmpA family protein [Zobellia amurskyensis]|uniref:OmpA family protein n=1 Tax=Zobellia amurskyensis TaxID=248905 RepID=A0A7X2ZUW5_9FLAO|nr:OmpA family protein [Zobellia amurskyensis]MUH36853.1 OmpA family protein [Zobellia amurskyensis]